MGLAASLYPWVASVRDELAGLKMQSDSVGKFRQALRRELKERFHLTDLIQTASVFHPTFNTPLGAFDKDRFSLTRQRLQQEFDDLISPGNISTQHPQPVRTSNDPGQEEDSPIHRFVKRQRIALGEAASEDTYPSEEIEHYFNRPMAASVVEPLGWWRLNKKKYPVMAKLARKYLAILHVRWLSSECSTLLEGFAQISAIVSLMQ
ncbi:Zinc finger BED domain-containing protein 1 [Linnemannia elongata]|nr:Zinc finger BED domain-containing protein 1 [Linnemannia elongata]